MANPKTNKILFIGGPSDGHRKTTQYHNTRVQVAALSNSGGYSPVCAASPAIGLTFSTHTYNLKTFTRADGTVLEIAVHDSIKDVMTHLVKGYRYHRNPRRSRGKLRHFTGPSLSIPSSPMPCYPIPAS